MTTKYLWSAVLLATASMALAAVDQPQATSPAGAASVSKDTNGAPHIKFEATTFEFGRIKQGEVVKHSFIFTNTGASTLEITEVKPGCGCTTAGAWDKKVEPGKTGGIPLQFNSTGFGGNVSKSAMVACNDPAQPNLTLVLSGSVWKPIDVTPTVAMFQVDAENQTNQTKLLRVVSNVDDPVTISDVRSTNPQFKTELKEVKPGKEFELAVSIVPPFTNTSAFGNISLKTSCALASNLTVSAYATLQQPITVSPQQIMLPAGPLANVHTSTVTIYYRGTNTLKVSDPEFSTGSATASLKEVQPGRMYVVQAVFPVGYKANPSERTELLVKTDNPKHPVVKVPVYQAQIAPPAAAPSTGIPAPQAQKVPTSQRQVPVRAMPAPAAK